MLLNELKYEVATKQLVLAEGLILNILQYLPTAKKITLIGQLQAECESKIILNQPLLNAFFNALIILYYTDLEVAPELQEKLDLLDLYDFFEANGYMSKIIAMIPDYEYSALLDYFQETINDYNKYKISPLGSMESLVALLPVLMERVNEISKEIDKDSLTLLKDIVSNIK